MVIEHKATDDLDYDEAERQEQEKSHCKYNDGKDPARIPKVLSAIERYWKLHPYLRLGQIIVNFTDSDPYYAEDESLLTELELEHRVFNQKGGLKMPVTYTENSDPIEVVNYMDLEAGHTLTEQEANAMVEVLQMACQLQMIKQALGIGE